MDGQDSPPALPPRWPQPRPRRAPHHVNWSAPGRHRVAVQVAPPTRLPSTQPFRRVVRRPDRFPMPGQTGQVLVLVGDPTQERISVDPRHLPVHAHRLAACGHLRQALGKLAQGSDEAAVGLAAPNAASAPSGRPRLSPTSVLEIPTIRPALRYDSPSNTTAATASRRTSRDSGRVPPRPGWRGGTRWARRPASQVRTLAGSDERGQYANETGPPRKGEGLPMVRSRTCPAHGAARTP